MAAAVARGEIPQVRMMHGKHKSHSCEEKVQAYLLRHAIATSLTYQTMVKNYGIPIVVRPSVISELVVACLGDLQSCVFDL